MDMSYVCRDNLSNISNGLFNGNPIVLLGPSHCGKTTAIRQILDQKSIPTLFLNGDNQIFASEMTNSQWQQIIGNKKCVVISESQKIGNMDSFFKLIYQHKQEVQVVFITSTAKTHIYLDKYGVPYELFPFTFAELSKHFGFLEERKKLDLRLIYGSYPEVVGDEDNMEKNLKLIAKNSFRQVLLQNGEKQKAQIFGKLLKVLALKCGKEISINELSTLLSVSQTVVEFYIQLLVETFIIFPLTPYFTNQENEIRNTCKYYFWDNGIRNAILNRFNPVDERKDVGALWENYLISERQKKRMYENADGLPYFWRTTDQMEVDYLEVTGREVVAYEFKWNAKKKSHISKAFTNRYPNAQVCTITPDNYDILFLQPHFVGGRK